MTYRVTLNFADGFVEGQKFFFDSCRETRAGEEGGEMK